MMKMEREMDIMSDRRISDPQPVIGTQIMDDNMPSQIDFKAKKKGSDNPEEFEAPSQITAPSQIKIKSFRVIGKGIFDIEPTYSENEMVKKPLNTFSVKAFDEKKSGGLKTLWESMIGFTKKELYIENGYFYVFQATGQGLQRQWAYKLSNLQNVFVDMQESSVRLVFMSESKRNIRINKNYQMESILPLIEKLVIQSRANGLTIAQQQF